MAERRRQPFEVGRDVPPRPLIERASLHCGVAEEATTTLGPATARLGITVERSTNRDERPDPPTAVQVTAVWRCSSDDHLDELKHWWQRVGTDAHEIEPGLVRYETCAVPGEEALVIHETFVDSEALKFHLTKGTAAKYKEDIDRIAAPDAHFFRGPVAWMIRTYSEFMRLPATYADG